MVKLNGKKMLEYHKTILSKVSFDAMLFEKELKKAIATCLPKEVAELKSWCYHKFGAKYNLQLQKCFSLSASNMAM